MSTTMVTLDPSFDIDTFLSTSTPQMQMQIQQHQGQEQEQEHRILQEKSHLDMESPGMIAWYCLLIFIVAPTIGCGVYCWLSRWASFRRARRALDRELAMEREQQILSQMEANVQAFSGAEKTRRKKLMQAMIRRQVIQVEAIDIKLAQQEDDTTYGQEQDYSAHTSVTTVADNDITTTTTPPQPAAAASNSNSISNHKSRRANFKMFSSGHSRQDSTTSSTHSRERCDSRDGSLHDPESQPETSDHSNTERTASTDNDSRTSGKDEPMPPHDPAIVSRLKALSCSICLDAFEVGDRVAHAFERSCKHVFHDECIVLWLMTQQHPLCPCCRQHFTQFGAASQEKPTTMNPSTGNTLGVDGTTAPVVSSRPRVRQPGITSGVITIPQQRNNQAQTSSQHQSASSQTPRSFATLLRRHNNINRSSRNHHFEHQSERTELATSCACSSRCDVDVDVNDLDEDEDILDDILVNDLEAAIPEADDMEEDC